MKEGGTDLTGKVKDNFSKEVTVELIIKSWIAK